MKSYNGRIPACGVFCGGCPIYTREKSPCKGAEQNGSRCEKCKTFHLCCLEKRITHCFQCSDFPCTKFKRFTKRWLKYGQNFIENQKLLKNVGEVKFLKYYNERVLDRSSAASDVYKRQIIIRESTTNLPTMTKNQE